MCRSAEAVVTGYRPGKGRLADMVGALVCSFNDKTFRIGTGLDDATRKDPPAVGSAVTFEYFELTPSGVPRFPVYVTCRDYE